MNRLSLRHLPAIMNHCLFQGGSGFARGGEQSLNEVPGLIGIKLNLMALIDDLAGNLTDMRNDKFSHGAPLNRGRLLEKLFVCRRHARDKSLVFLFFNHCWHAPNVRLRGTQCNNLLI